MLTFGSLFAGIGGIDLGLERAGMHCVWQVENDPYAVRVLEKHWPGVKRYRDIREIDWGEVERPDLVCGGFPCQPVSLAGKGLGQEDERWLWPEFYRCLCELRPRYVFVENVPGLLVRGMGDVLGELASLGHNAEWESLPAAAFGAPHLRYRVFIVAYAQHGQHNKRESQDWTANSGTTQRRSELWSTGRGENVADAEGRRLGYEPMGVLGSREGEFLQRDARLGGLQGGGRSQWAVEPDVGRVAHGVPSRVDRLRCLGNAVVPQVAEWIGRQILARAIPESLLAPLRSLACVLDQTEVDEAVIAELASRSMT